MKRVALAALVAVGVLVALGIQGKEGSGYRVIAIFDTAAFVVPGEDVKVAGVKVGSISSLRVTPDNKAAVEFSIEEAGYQDFREDATCSIRPQSLIGEQFVECALTQPRGVGEPEAGPLPEGDGGVPVIPVEQTRTTVALDLIGNINRLPVRQRLSLILSELGAGLAGRGEDLNEVIRRAAPALQETNDVLRLVADQNKVLQQLAVDSDAILAPLADEREAITRTITSTTELADATVERQTELAQNFQKLPTFLREIRPTMDRLVDFSDQTIPLANDLLGGAQDINKLIQQTAPFARAATPALTRLGGVAEPGIPALRASLPIVEDLRDFGQALRPVAKDLADVLTSLQRNDGIERVLDYIYFQVQAINGFDTFGHFLRAGLVVNTCSTYAVTPQSECLSKFVPTATTRSATSTGDPVLDRTARVLAGEDPDDVLSPEGQERVRALVEQYLAPLRESGALPPAGEVPADDGDDDTEAPATTDPTPEPTATGTPESTDDLLDFLFDPSTQAATTP